MRSFSTIDNKLAAANMAIGGSSNLAQLCLSYTYNFSDQKYIDYVCILSVLAQCSIDNAKRAFDVDLNAEIDRIKKDMNIDINSYPLFFANVLKNNARKRDKSEGKINSKNYKVDVNKDLVCPMNYLYSVQLGKYRSSDATLGMEKFFVNYSQDNNRRKSKKVEELIEKYSIDLYNSRMNDDEDDYFVLRHDFDKLIEDIKSVYVSKNYLGLMSWLINRAFCITNGAKSKLDSIDSNIHKNRSLLLKTLYTINPEGLLKCFAKNVENAENKQD